MNTAQILTVLGLYFEFVSGIIMIRKLFYGKMRRIMEHGQTEDMKTKQNRFEGSLVILFLTVGMVLQGLAVFF